MLRRDYEDADLLDSAEWHDILYYINVIGTFRLPIY